MAAILRIDLEHPDSDALKTVAHEIIHGRLVIYPTDTIYGIGADACNPKAVGRVFEIKKRDPKNPLLVLVNSLEMAKDLLPEIPDVARVLIQKFWPGPLTLIFKASSRLTPKLSGGTGTVGVRYPNHSLCLKLLEICQRPITSTSANISGQNQTHSIREISKTFDSTVDLIVDSGDIVRVKPSTIIDVSGKVPRLVREGAIPYDELGPYLGMEIQ